MQVNNLHPLSDKNGPEFSPKQWSSLVGIVTAIIGNILISFALNTQRYAHIRIEKEQRFKHDQRAKDARKHLPKAIRNYGTAIEQEQVAEERARINANASGLGDAHTSEEENEDRPLLTNGKRRESEVSLRHKEDEDDDEAEERPSYLKSSWWWLGIVLMTIGEAGNFLAYGFAPASIVSPLGVVALISNCLIAPLMLKEHFRQRDLWGVMIAIAGAVVVVLSANQSEQKLDPDYLWKDIRRWEFLAYVLITVVLIVALMFASPKYGSRSILIDLGLVGLFGGYTALSTKGVASLLSTSLYRAFTYPIFYVLILVLALSAIMQIRYINRALQNFSSTQVIPVQFVLFTLSVIIGSAVLYRDFQRTNTDHAIKFVIGCLLTFGGVYLITSGREKGEEDDHDDLHESEQIRLIDEEAQTYHEDDSLNETTVAQVNGNATKEPSTPPQRSPASSRVPSIAVTPSSLTPPGPSHLSDINRNPLISSTDHLDRTAERDLPSIPQTPVAQIIPNISSSQTPFFTPSTSLRQETGQKTRPSLPRSASSPNQPKTPTRDQRGPSPPKPDESVTIRSKRSQMGRFLPGPFLPPLSSSLSGIVAESLRRGEGSPFGKNIRASLRSRRSQRDSRRMSGQTDGDFLTPGVSSSIHTPIRGSGRQPNLRYSSEMQLPLARTISAVDDTSREGSEGGSIQNVTGRLRSMSETLSGLMRLKRNPTEDGSSTTTPQ